MDNRKELEKDINKAATKIIIFFGFATFVASLIANTIMFILFEIF